MRATDDGGVSLHLLLGVMLIGAGIGFVSGAFGKGGSAVSTPLLHAIGVPAMAAIASPLPATIPSTLLASRSYARAGHLDRRVIRIGLVVGLPAIVIGAWCTQWIPGGSLVLVTDVLVLTLGLRVLLGAPADELDDAFAPVPALWLVAAVAGAVGVPALGRGWFPSPLFITCCTCRCAWRSGRRSRCRPRWRCRGRSCTWLGHIDWSLTLALGLAAIPLATVGARAARAAFADARAGAGLTLLAGGLLTFAQRR